MAVIERLDSYDSPVADGPDLGMAAFELDARALALALVTDHDHNFVSGVDQLLEVEAVVIPSFGPLGEELDDAVVASIDRVLDPCLGIGEVPLDLGGHAREDRFHVARSKRLSYAAHYLHVLLRHRPRSIPQAQD